VEANNIFDSSCERPADIYVVNESTKINMAIDVSLTSPHILENKSVDSVEGFAACKKQQVKLNKYGPRLNNAGITCAPLVFEHYGGFTAQTESAIINQLASAWAKNHSSLTWEYCKKNVIDRLTIEHAKIISRTFVLRIRPKQIDNSIPTNHAMYDGSSGFKSWTNRENPRKAKMAMGPLLEDIIVKDAEWFDAVEDEWGADPKEEVAPWVD